MSDNLFHAHLDICKQCRDNPMMLCDKGAFALRVAAGFSTEEAFKKFEEDQQRQSVHDAAVKATMGDDDAAFIDALSATSPLLNGWLKTIR